jgi:hypothetical protein
MIYNIGWANLRPQESKYTATLAAEAAKLIEAGQNLSAVSRTLNISRASLRNWRDRNPKLNASFAVFEANKLKTAAHQQHVAKYKQVAQEIVDSARDGAADPVEAGVKAHQQAEQEVEESKPMSKEQRQQIRINEWFNSDWSEEIAAQEARAQAERDAAERATRAGFWCG